MKLFTLLALLPSTLALTISEINGNHYLSSHKNTAITNLKGLVTAKGSSGFYIRSTNPDSDSSTSESIYVYGSTAVSQVSVGDIITLDGKVSEYRSSKSYVYLTEITSPFNIVVDSSDNKVTPVVIGKDGLSPPTEQFSALDDGDILGVPNDVSQISTSNPALQPDKYGMDFWESLSGELVSISGLRAIAKPNRYGNTWVVGDWETTGGNERGGLTMRRNDSNPEAILIGSPLDGTDNPTDTKLGDTLADITGIITNVYGFYTLLPLTALNVTGSNTTIAAPTTLVSDGSYALSIGSYNVENLSPDSDHLSKVAEHIVDALKSPTLVFVQEIQDDDGATDDGVVSANKTLATLTQSIKSQGGPSYSFVDINPVSDADGGQPGGNIRVAYLYDSSIIQLRNENSGSSTDANDIVNGELKYNPGLIDPSNDAWESTRKPLVAEWETIDGKNRFFTVNVHLTSKDGGSSLEGDARPPVNGGIDKREAQAKLVANFTSTLLSQSPNAKILVSGDFNEFTFASPMETLLADSGLKDLDEVVGVPATERYTYLYGSNCQQLDHMFISEGFEKDAKMEHVHVNTWVAYGDQVSDHDPTVARLNVYS